MSDKLIAYHRKQRAAKSPSRFERVNTGDYNQHSFRDKLTDNVYSFDTQKEAEAKMEELRNADI